MKLTEEECKVIEENYALCYWFAKKRYPNENALIAAKIDYDDLVEFGHIALCKAARTYDSEKACTFCGWFREIAKREVLQEIRRNLRDCRKALCNSVSYDADIDDEENKHSILSLIPSPEPQPIDLVIRQDVLDNAKQAVDEVMTPKQSEAFKMWCYEYKTHEEIAAILGIGQTGATHRIQRGTKSLQTYMAAIGYELEDVI